MTHATKISHTCYTANIFVVVVVGLFYSPGQKQCILELTETFEI